MAGATVEAPGSQSSAFADPEQTRAPTDLPRSADRTPTPGSATLQAGQQFTKRYTIIKLLGAGGMGEVYHAWDGELGTSVALKIVRPDLSLDPIDSELLEQRFKRELRLARQVTHPNVVRIHDLGDVNQIKYLTMEYVQGADLGALLRRQGKFPIARALSIARQVAAGLEAVHKAGIVHRDLKPANVIINDEDHARLTDFGIARPLEGKTLYTMPGAVVGTLEYMAPEQARGEPVDQRSDIYAFGLILYDLIAGGRSSSKSDGLASLIERLEKGPPPLSAVDPSVPADTERIVARCLRADPAARYQSISEVLADIDRLGPDGHARPGVVVPPPSWRKVGPFGGAAVAIVLLAGLLVWKQLHAPPTAPQAPHEPISVLIADFNNATGDPVFDGSLEQALGVAIEGASFVTAYPRSAAIAAVRAKTPGARLGESEALLVAVREGIRIVLSGSIERARNGYTLNVKALNGATHEAVSHASESASEKLDVLQAIGKVAERLRRALGDNAPPDQFTSETFSAASLDAVKDYTIAQALSTDRRNDEAIEYYKRAVKKDPTFGRAYAGWASAEYDLGRRAEAQKHWDQATQYINQMTERERHRTLGIYYLAVAHNNEKAIDEFTELVKKYPADLAGHNNLAVAYFNKLDFANALKEGQRAIELYPKSLKFRGNYALYAMYASDFKTAAANANQILRDDPGYVPAYLPLAMEALSRDDIAGAKEVYTRAGRTGAEGESLAAIGLADIALYEGHPADAAAALPVAIDADVKAKNTAGAAAKTIALAEAHAALGHATDALKAINDALQVSREDVTLVPATRILLRNGQFDRASAMTKELRDRLQPQSRAYATILQAEAAIVREKPADAVVMLGEGKDNPDLWLLRFVRGVAYESAQHHVEAIADLNACLQRRGEATALFLDDIPTFRYTAPLREWLRRTNAALGAK